MNDFGIPRNFISVLAALVLALVMTFLPNASAFADDQTVQEKNAVVITRHQVMSEDAALLRLLLSSPERDVREQVLLDRTLNDVYEERADDTPTQPASPKKGFIKSVNDLLGIKPTTRVSS